MEETSPKPECAKEVLDLLNCVTKSPYDVAKCIDLLDNLRHCVVDKNVTKFSLADPGQQEPTSASKKD